MTDTNTSHFPTTNMVSLPKVMQPDWILHKKNKYLCGIILAIKVNQGKGKVRAYSSKNTMNDTGYDHILTIADLLDPDGSCFVLIYHDQRESSSKMMFLRDQDKAVGQIVFILEPIYRQTFMSSKNDLPIISSKRYLFLPPNILCP